MLGFFLFFFKLFFTKFRVLSKYMFRSYWCKYVTRHDISRLMEVKRHKEKNVVKVSRCETCHTGNYIFYVQQGRIQGGGTRPP